MKHIPLLIIILCVAFTMTGYCLGRLQQGKKDKDKMGAYQIIFPKHWVHHQHIFIFDSERQVGYINWDSSAFCKLILTDNQ